MSFAERWRTRPWKTRSGSRKKNTARFRPCSRRRRRSLLPSSMLRDGSSSSAAWVLLHCERRSFVGNFRNARSRGVYWTPAARRGVTKSDRSANPVAEPGDFVAGRAVAGVAGAERRVRVARSRARPGAVLPAGNSRGRGVELFLLPRDSTDKRSHRHHFAVHGAGLGAALYRSTGRAAAIVAQKRGGGTGRNGLCAGGRLCRLAPPSRCGRNRGRTTGCIFLCVL